VAATCGGDGAVDWLLATGAALVRLTGEGRVVGLQPAAALCLAVDPADARAAFAGLSDGQVLRTVDAGRTWAPFATIPFPVFSLAVSPWDGSLYAGCEPSALFKWEGRAPQAPRRLGALEALPSRPRWSFPPRPWTSHVRWIAPAPHGPALVCGIELGGVLYSADGGEAWLDQRPGAHADCHALAWPAPGWLWEAAGGGVARSRDGRSWEACNDGLDRRYAWGLVPLPGDPAAVIVSASPSPAAAHHSLDGADACLYRRRGDGAWRRLNGQPASGLPERFSQLPTALAAVPGEAGHVVAWLRDGQAWETRDGGDEWVRLRGPLAAGTTVHAAVAVGEPA
jgi:hypothetical protein